MRAHDIPGSIVLDSGARSAAARGDDWVQAELTLAQQFGIEVHVSSVTLAETLRAHRRDARVHSVLGGALPNAVTHQLGRGGGELIGRTGENDTVDAIVAVSAEALGQRVRLLTGDPADLKTLTTDMPNVSVVRV